MKDANSRALAEQFKKMGLSKEDINRRFTEFGQPANEWKAGQIGL